MRDPGSLWSPLPESGRQGTARKDKFIVHSTSGVHDTAAAVFGYFARADVVVESTFIIGKTSADPTRQILDSSEVADANLQANGPGISVEVCGSGFEPFTDWQVSELIRLGRWAAANHPIALQQVPTATASGFGWHVMFGAPGPWTPAVKVCPGDQRIAQLKSTIFPAIFSGDDMPLTDADVTKIFWGTKFRDQSNFAQVIHDIEDLGNKNAAAIADLATKVADPGGVDIDKLADLVVDRLSARLSN